MPLSPSPGTEAEPITLVHEEDQLDNCLACSVTTQECQANGCHLSAQDSANTGGPEVASDCFYSIFQDHPVNIH